MVNAKDEVLSFIRNALLTDEMKEQIQLFEDYLERRKNNNSEEVLNIVIENFSKSETDILLECILDILKEWKITDDIVTIDDIQNIENYEDSVLLINVDEMDDFQKSWRISSENFIFLLSKCFDKHNSLILTTKKSFHEYEVFAKSNIHSIIPAFHFFKDEDIEEIYDRLIFRFKKGKILYKLSFDDFFNIYQAIHYNDYVIHMDIDYYLYMFAVSSMEYIKSGIVTKDAFSNLLESENNDEENKGSEKISINKLTGLGNVKKEVDSLFHYASFIKDMNINKNNTYLNMFFLGNPGTGKTMIANIIANKLYELGYLNSSEVIKIVPTDLIGEYVGHTKKTIRKILENAEGKLLFIDEAYLIGQTSYSKGKNPFMEEAMIELLKYLEDPSHIVIFAGYQDEMRKLYNMNPGLKSRIYKEIIFDDYSIKELYKILSDDLDKKGMVINKKDKGKFTKYIKEIREDKNFGNARSMLQLSQKLIMNHANHCNKENKFIIDRNDLPTIEVHNQGKMGFSIYDGR